MVPARRRAARQGGGVTVGRAVVFLLALAAFVGLCIWAADAARAHCEKVGGRYVCRTVRRTFLDSRGRARTSTSTRCRCLVAPETWETFP